MPIGLGTLSDWLADARAANECSVDLASVVVALADACTEVACSLRTAALDGYVGTVSASNVHGEQQKALDVLAHEIFVRRLSAAPAIGMLASEEVEEAIVVRRAPLGVSFDPLDGSSNSDVNMTVGSIFSVHEIDLDAPSLLKTGRQQVAAGFAAYGPSTSLILTFGKSAALFILDPSSGQFLLHEPRLAIASRSAEFAINAARAPYWDEVMATYISDRITGRGHPLGTSANMRWTASMVADVQRILSRGGIFLYPADSKTKQLGGRLRLLYEAAPIAMIVEAAGGRATTGMADLLDLVPTGLHQKVPVILGSANDVADVEKAYRWARISRRTKRRSSPLRR